jgi:HEAT repeat protein
VAGLLLVLNVDALAQCRDEIKAKVDYAFSSIRVEKTFTGFSRQLREIGSPAVPCVLDFMSREGYRLPVMKIILLDFVSQAEGAEVEASLIELLRDKQPELRGYAVFELGKRKVKRAIPILIERLDDKENTIVLCALNNPCDDILVRDLAIKALESITGVKPTNSKNKEKQVKAWRRWWMKQYNQEVS